MGPTPNGGTELHRTKCVQKLNWLELKWAYESTTLENWNKVILRILECHYIWRSGWSTIVSHSLRSQRRPWLFTLMAKQYHHLFTFALCLAAGNGAQQSCSPIQFFTLCLESRDWLITHEGVWNLSRKGCMFSPHFPSLSYFLQALFSFYFTRMTMMLKRVAHFHLKGLLSVRALATKMLRRH